MSKTTQKDPLDRFYTKDSVAQGCVGSLQDILPTFDTLVEPSAGGGAFLRALQQYLNVVGYDLSPAANGVVEADWFTVDLSNMGDNICVVGNPPFGKRNSLSKAFIKHALSFDNVSMVAMILPNSWNKPSLQNSTFPTKWRLVINNRLEEKAFLLGGEEYEVPCTFQVWVKGDYKKGVDLRWELKPETTHEDFEFVTKEDADIFMMGAAPKVLKLPTEVVKSNRGYFIKANIPVQELLRNFSKIPWDLIGNATAGGGVYWISKPELIKAYKNFC